MRDHGVEWLAVCLVISMTLVHLVYWSNLRMRTPLEPFLALLATGCFGRFGSHRERETADDGSNADCK